MALLQRAELYAKVRATLDAKGQGDLYETITQEFYERWLRPGDVAIDCGANIGRHAIPMARAVGPDGKIYAFEPVPLIRGWLNKHIAASGVENIEVRHLALGAKPGKATFSVIHGAYGMGGLQKRGDLETVLADPKVEEITVEVARLDDALAGGADECRFIKLDLEGGEFHALAGGQKLIAKSRTAIIFENGRSASATDYSYSKDDFFELFRSLDYQLYDALGFEFGPDQWTAESAWQFVALPRENREVFTVLLAAASAALVANNLPTLIAA